MSTTSTLKLPYLYPQQAQKHVTVNEALRALDMLVQPAPLSRQIIDPQSLLPEDGQCWIVPENAVGDWAGRDNDLVAWQDEGWSFSTPSAGWIVYVSDEESLLAFDGSGWTDLLPDFPDTLPRFGINTEADATNRLAVKSDAVLISHDDVTPGNGSVRFCLNRRSGGDAASLILQTGFEGRAEIGLDEKDDFQIKVSADGVVFRPVLVIDRESGRVSQPNTPPVAAPFNLLKDGGRFAGVPEPTSVAVGAFVAPGYVGAYNGAEIVAGPQFHHNNATFGGSNAVLHPEIEALMLKVRTGSAQRYGVEFHTLRITAGEGSAASVGVSGADPHALLCTSPSVPIPAQLTVNYHLHVLSGSAAVLADTFGRTFIDGFEVGATTQILPDDGWCQATRLYDRVPSGFSGYHPSIFGLYAMPRTELLFAAPTITPGHVPMGEGQIILITPGLEAWR
ncbi:DUF2793 domain-containing protein [Notoacmeibacter ruber]|uniref:DUF2793 domain-containing protein n=1 Tax=Notoacmeibacter ruber TaxID=2670375 RepID=A0A3L7JC19_9HYPH|nr:DUF2793 domain-containing protein [Notoacmeibacter ruber]RLQ88277.1 DUF2793 domain-containing protein [Notoacmeibacter ruber]